MGKSFISYRMEAIEMPRLFSAADYLAGERTSDVRHEYVGGHVYAMAGGSEEHNTLGLNLASALRAHLRGKPCRVYMADMKVALRIASEEIFYYPDVMVVCDARDTDRYVKRLPRVVIEVLSPETERTDRREKFLGYTQIETLEEYVLVAQDKMENVIYRRANRWQPEVFTKAEHVLRLASLDFEVLLSAVYERVSV